MAAARPVPGNARPSVLAIHSTAVLLRSCPDPASAPGAYARDLRGVGQQHRGGKEQGRLGGGTQSRWQSGLHTEDSAEGESCSVRGEDRKQRGGAVIAAVCAYLLHDYPRLARETDPRLPLMRVFVPSIPGLASRA